ncbi:MAG: M3 family oligoendopeptidase [Ignavibacteria bacterium]|nr:M3 family oligoendopeptidase [Ignavibacteria bacterium]
MKFKDFPYQRPDIEKYKEHFENQLVKLENAMNYEAQVEAIHEINILRDEFDTMGRLANVRYTINTADDFYFQEKKFLDSIAPLIKDYDTRFYRTLINSKFRKKLEDKIGKHLFNLAEVSVKTFNPEIENEIIKTNELTVEYKQLMAAAKIMFDGKELNLSGFGPHTTSPDREVRKKASETKWSYFKKNEKEFDRIFDELVKTRDKMAKKLGYKNYIELAYYGLKRTDYNADDVAAFRKQILETIVPITKKLREKQQKRLGLDNLYYYDEGIHFPTGNAKPRGNTEEIIKNTLKMYKELSEETGEFFEQMYVSELMDLENKKNKAVGGYCTFLKLFSSPFIFSNFNGTEDDIRVLTHEAGHAFQAFCSKDFEISEYLHPTLEACEIHSMSMEFITWDWMNLFFEEDTGKFKYFHLVRALEFLPYCVSVDEFQHWVYENPDAAPSERKKKWREIEHKYLPLKNYDDNSFLEEGGYWQQQRHIYEKPFYYIDYGLAQVCAFQFWKKMNASSKKENTEALKDYIELCKAGGSRSFLDLLKIAKLDSPFKKDTVKKAIKPIVSYLDDTDDELL